MSRINTSTKHANCPSTADCFKAKNPTYPLALASVFASCTVSATASASTSKFDNVLARSKEWFLYERTTHRTNVWDGWWNINILSHMQRESDTNESVELHHPMSANINKVGIQICIPTNAITPNVCMVEWVTIRRRSNLLDPRGHRQMNHRRNICALNLQITCLSVRGDHTQAWINAIPSRRWDLPPPHSSAGSRNLKRWDQHRLGGDVRSTLSLRCACMNASQSIKVGFRRRQCFVGFTHRHCTIK